VEQVTALVILDHPTRDKGTPAAAAKAGWDHPCFLNGITGFVDETPTASVADWLCLLAPCEGTLKMLLREKQFDVSTCPLYICTV
jgi:hypothetical protein